MLTAVRPKPVTEREALAIYQKPFGREHPAVAASLNNLAFVLGGEGKLDAAEALFREALPLNRKLLGDEHPQVGICLSRFGTVLQDQGRFPEAEEMYREAVTIQTKLLDKKASDLSPKKSELAPNVELAWTLKYLSVVLEKQNKLSEAEAAIDDALSVISKVVGGNHPDWITLFRDFVRIKLRRGKVADVKSVAEALFQTENRRHEPALNYIAWLLATSPDSAVRDGSSAVKFAEQAVATTERKNLNYLDTLAAAYAEVGEFAKAISVQHEAIALSHNEKMKKDLESRLELYQSNFPYRVP